MCSLRQRPERENQRADDLSAARTTRHFFQALHNSSKVLNVTLTLFNASSITGSASPRTFLTPML
jgi:hypothetical protein